MLPGRRVATRPRGVRRDEPDAHQERLDDRLDGLGLLADRHRERVEADRTAVEPREDDLHHRAVEPVEAERVDVVELERRVHRLEVDPAASRPPCTSA